MLKFVGLYFYVAMYALQFNAVEHVLFWLQSVVYLCVLTITEKCVVPRSKKKGSNTNINMYRAKVIKLAKKLYRCLWLRKGIAELRRSKRAQQVLFASVVFVVIPMGIWGVIGSFIVEEPLPYLHSIPLTESILTISSD